jgi:G:T-mismatch repair DNA endonuclease (very short patch repair protein)
VTSTPSPISEAKRRACFRHCCAEHGTYAKANAAWWKAKLEHNVAQDSDTEARLRDAGWEVIVVWEHEDPETAAARVESAVRQRRAACPASHPGTVTHASGFESHPTRTIPNPIDLRLELTE